MHRAQNYLDQSGFIVNILGEVVFDLVIGFDPMNAADQKNPITLRKSLAAKTKPRAHTT